jgi:hypothetical protein
MYTEKLKIKYKTQNTTQTNPQIKSHKRSHEPRMIRPQTQYQNPEHMYLKFLTPQAPSVEKTGNLHGFR